MELLERLVKALESIAASLKDQTEAFLSQVTAPAGTESPTETAKRTRKKKDEPATTVEVLPASDLSAPPEQEIDFGSEPEKQVTMQDINELLKKLSVHPKVGLAKAKEILRTHSGGKDRLSEADPAALPVIYKAAKEALDAAA